MQGSSSAHIHANANLDELIRQTPELVSVFIEHRMHCVGCPVARFETVADACRIYGKPLEGFLHALRSVSGQADRGHAASGEPC